MHFSPLPSLLQGFLTSLDDFYLLGSGLLMTQTTNSVFNTSLFTLITPHSLLAWQRVRLAHTLGSSGPIPSPDTTLVREGGRWMTHESLSWFIPLIMVYSTECIFFTHFFTLPPSLGTYNNQYMIVDMGKVTLGHSIEDGALTVVEQIPGLVEFSDQTRALRRGEEHGYGYSTANRYTS